MTLDTPEARATFIGEASLPLFDVMMNLCCRWQDEKGHEDFNEYEKIMIAKALECFPGAKHVVCSKFNLTMDIPGIPYPVMFYVTTRKAGWKAV
jgi:hypothetical protein